MKLIYLIRHGLTDCNAKGIIQGHIDDSLSSEGRQQALRLRDHFKKTGTEFDLVFSSDLKRASETAAIACDSEVTEDSQLREIMLGDWQGRPVKELIAQTKLWEMWKYKPGQINIPGAEKLSTVQDRAWKSLLKIKGRDFEKAALVTHGGVIGLLICRILGSDIDRVWEYRHENTAYTIIDATNSLKILKQNESEHLPDCKGFEKWKFVK